MTRSHDNDAGRSFAGPRPPSPAAGRALWVMLVICAAAALTVAALILFSEPGSESELAGGLERPPADRIDQAAFTGETAEERIQVAPSGELGEAAVLNGRLFLNGAPLAGVTLQAVADPPQNPAPSFLRRLQSSPLYYSAHAADVIKTIDALGEPDLRPPLPSAECRSGRDGAFTLSLRSSATVAFQLDHDFYYLPPGESGPLTWKTGAAGRSLDRFDGMLVAEVGAMVRGTVTDGDGCPLAGAVVTIAERDSSDGWGAGGFLGGWGERSFEERQALADERGEFAFRGVEPGRTVFLTAALDRFAPGTSPDIETVPGQMEQAELRLYDGAAIRVLVRGPDAAPMESAEVYLERTGTSDGAPERGRGGPGRGLFMGGGPEIAGKGVTGKDGEVVFDSLAPGDYSVKACFPGLAEQATGAPLAVKADTGVLSVELSLVSGSAVSGTVVDDLQRPVAGALVRALPHMQRGGFGGRGDAQAWMEIAAAPPGALKQAFSSAAGAFLITGLSSEKTYDLFAEAEELAPAESRGIEPGTSGAVLVMDRSGRIEGRVLAAATGQPVGRFTVRVLPAPEDDERGVRAGVGRWQPGGRTAGEGPGGPAGRGGDARERESADPARTVFEAVGEIWRRASGPSRAPTDRETDFADSRGVFLMKGIIPGRYRLCVSAGGLAPALTEPFEVVKGETRDGLTVALRPGASIAGESVSGYGPVAGAGITIRAERDQAEDLDVLLETLDGFESDAGGAFQIDSLPAGRFNLRASHPDHPPVSLDALELREGQAVAGVVLRFPPGARIIGTAYDEAGAPLQEQMVSCRPAEGRGGDFKRERTDREGRFEFSQLRAGSYRVSIPSGGMEFRGLWGGEDADSVQVDLSEGGLAEIMLQRKPPEGATVQGMVVGGAGPPGRGFLTVAPPAAAGRGERGERAAMRSCMVEENGSYKVEGVTPGLNRFSLRFMVGESFESTTLEFDIPDRQVVHLDIPLPSGRIAGVVFDEVTRLPLPDVRVSLSEEGEDRGGGGGPWMRGFGGRGRSATTGADGSFQFRMLTPGTYSLEAQPPDDLGTGGGEYYSTEISGLALAEGQAKDGVAMFLGPGGSIAVKVVDENNAPVEGAMVAAIGGAEPEQGGGRRSRTDADGSATVDGIAPGIYTVNVQARRMAQRAIGGVSVLSGRTVEETVVMRTGFPVSIRLTGPDGGPVTAATLTLTTSRGDRLSVPGGRFGRGSNNVYSLGTLSAGRYSVEAEWEGGTGAAEFDIVGEGTVSVALK